MSSILLLLAALAAATLILWLIRRESQPLRAPELELATHSLALDGWDYHYLEAGSGPTIILLHGIGANFLCWRNLWPLLQDNFHVIALDVPGFGRSSKHDGDYGLDAQAERLERFLAAKGLHNFHLIGNSMGANLALWLASRNKDQVLSLTVIAPATSSGLVPLPFHAWPWLASVFSQIISRPLIRWAHQRTVNSPGLVDDLRVAETWHTYGRNRQAVKTFLLATSAIRDRRLSKVVQNLPLEVLILWGENDLLVPRQVVEDLHRAIPKSYVKIHPSAGHHLQEDDPQWVRHQLNLFLGPKNI